MFHPRFRNFFLSNRIEWKKQRQNKSFLYFSGLRLELKWLSVICWYRRLVFAFSPFGGSVVILMLLCKMAIGKSGLGLELSHRRKSLCTWSIWSCSTILSSCGIQLRDKWQLAKKTHCPDFAPSLIRFVATTAWPWPRERLVNREAILQRSANSFRYLFGS